ncbi:hypothetical protein F503_04019 [Ophiostoma piceae UAMH 11346]|uniref:Uncharacterized protein n=1 Tax=Ophiostoma piceae (strain UAMH 11346) TaxID=1262450 RepID=S3CQ02_OPHP1|nr:hypothetical protein F503_04019 [Ophiostoma piceae UAMH 11346]
MFADVLSFFLLLAPALAAHRTMNMASIKLAEDTSYQWTVENWEASYGGAYDFNISAPYSGGQFPVPAFVAHCAGSAATTQYALCNITDIRNTTRRRQIVSKLMPATNASSASLAVSYKFDDLTQSNAWWNYTSYATQLYAANATDVFAMKPSEVYGVA